MDHQEHDAKRRALDFGVKEVGTANTSQGAQRRTEVFVVSRRHDAAATLPETGNALTVGNG